MPARAAEAAARGSYGRLLAYLAARCRDVAAAEDALAEAFAAALESWPRDGVPDRPEAWLLTAARRRLVDRDRRSRVRGEAATTLRLAAEEAQDIMNQDRSLFPDDRLKLLFTCAHPAIDQGLRTALMLQVVLGLDATRIAGAFLVTPAAMAQRLVRAKAKIRDAGIPFAEPDRAELPPRLAAVLEAIYAAYGAGWEDPAALDPARIDLAREAIDLARLTTHLLPAEAEAKGLLALLLFCEARSPARRDPTGAYVALSDQDPSKWSRPLLAEAERMLALAAAAGRPGPFQLEAAIQSAHSERVRNRPVPWRAIADLYRALVATGGGLGARIGLAAATGEADGPAAGLAILDAIQAEAVAEHQPYWACRAHLLGALGSIDQASASYERAMRVSRDPAVSAFLADRRDRLVASRLRPDPALL